MKMFFHLLPGEKGQAVIGRMTESLIGAVGLKEFVFGTSFLSASFKDQDSLGAAPSSPPVPSFPCSVSLPISQSRARSQVYLLFLFLRFLASSSTFLPWPLTTGQALLNVSRRQRGLRRQWARPRPAEPLVHVLG